MSFADALEENRIPPRLGDVSLRYDEGRMVGESRPPSWPRRLLPELCLLLAALCALGSLGTLLSAPSHLGAPIAWGLLAGACVGLGLRLEGRLARRRFVLHFRSETLRLEHLTWAPGTTRTQVIPFDDVTSVEVVHRPASGRRALLVAWRVTPEQPSRQAALVEHILESEEETLRRVSRMLRNAFGLKASAPGGP
ncbi:hypothetical protein [Stigmatella aurantiaca]|uniref:Uncharacterized protein n=2 Tax=Stigmatella aurantiaca (strain DW4/3-1) TaxID=378806 RepID=E3FZZ6_STIAD|nr:hypothetical protein [Stigmatella aurantiaca]ADO71199.1 uncharacterized protein STAUR_3407 [Stigmatella aurantiaca DW4/3-1]